MAEVQEHRNGIQSIEVQLLSIKDKDGNEVNKWYGRSPTYKDADGKEHPRVINMVRGEAERLITAKRAIATSDIKAKAKSGRPPANKAAPVPSNK